MNRYIIYKEFDRLKLTNETNYNAYIRNASQVIDVDNFDSASAVRDYLVSNWSLLPHQIIDKTNN